MFASKSVKGKYLLIDSGGRPADWGTSPPCEEFRSLGEKKSQKGEGKPVAGAGRVLA